MNPISPLASAKRVGAHWIRKKLDVLPGSFRQLTHHAHHCCLLPSPYICGAGQTEIFDRLPFRNTALFRDLDICLGHDVYRVVLA